MQEPSVCEEKVYSAIYRNHAKELRNFIFYRYGDLERAEDIVQDSFVKLWAKCSQIIYSKVVGFLYKVCNNLALDQLRSKKVALKFEKSLVLVNEQEDPYFQLRTSEFKTKLEKVISDLPEKQREAFLMNRIDKLSYKEIAKRLGVSQTAIEKRISKALLKLNSIEEIKKFSI